VKKTQKAKRKGKNRNEARTPHPNFAGRGSSNNGGREKERKKGNRRWGPGSLAQKYEENGLRDCGRKE